MKSLQMKQAGLSITLPLHQSRSSLHSLRSHLSHTYLPSLQQQIQAYHKLQMQSVTSIVYAYDKEMKELREQIERQRGVIGRMRGQLEELVGLVEWTAGRQHRSNENSFDMMKSNHKESSRSSFDQDEYEQLQQQNQYNSRGQSHQSPTTTPESSMRPLPLPTIQEEDTERTILSSARSRRSTHSPMTSPHHNRSQFQYNQEEETQMQKKVEATLKKVEGWMRIEQQQEINNQKRQHQQFNNIHLEIYEEKDQCSHASYRLPPKIQDISPGNCLTQGNYRSNDPQMYSSPTDSNPARNHFATQQTEITTSTFRAEQQLTSSKLHQPIFIKKQLREMKDITNKSQNQPNPSQNIPKTRLFLQQFRKTFNKCINSTQINRKTSNKLNAKQVKSYLNNTIGDSRSDKENNISKIKQEQYASQNNPSLQVTFGKEKQKPREKEKEKEHNHQQTSHKLINEMLRDLDSNHKFIIGSRKTQVRYEGQHSKEGQRHGNGILYYLNGLCYQGQFKAGLRHGYGILKFNHIQIYNGDWIGDQISGQGKIRNCAIINKRKAVNSSNSASTASVLSKWISYCGDFRNSRFQGQGTMYLQGGEKFLGKFICGMACGEGTLYKKNGEIETGIWRNNLLIQKF